MKFIWLLTHKQTLKNKYFLDKFHSFFFTHHWNFSFAFLVVRHFKCYLFDNVWQKLLEICVFILEKTQKLQVIALIVFLLYNLLFINTFFSDFPVQGCHRMRSTQANLFAILNSVQQPYALCECYSVWHFMTLIQQPFSQRRTLAAVLKRTEDILSFCLWSESWE